jgi:hypothetical protein
MVCQSASFARASALRSSALSLAKAFSIGLKSGEYGAKASDGLSDPLGSYLCPAERGGATSIRLFVRCSRVPWRDLGWTLVRQPIRSLPAAGRMLCSSL